MRHATAGCLLAFCSMVAATGARAADDAEAWNAHFQTTYVWQKKPSVRSPYEGPNSLQGAAEKSYSWTGTAAIGLRLARSTELYFNPEVALGVPLSGLLGLAGFTNGELAKTSGANPTFYRARLFVRHTVDLGGEEQALAPAANQLGAAARAERLVLTAGAISVLDIFDANGVAHDPRTQFLNWSFMTHAAYDYPADSRGYTWGAAAEYLGDGWALRGGRFAVPREPNQLLLDGRVFRHYGDQVELSRDYTLAGQSGTLRLLAFRLRAVLADYAGALAATPGVPTLDATRTTERTKRGFGVNLEHRVSDALGLFARAFRADGKTETYAFTEADRSLSVGGRLKGAAWGRGDDALGAGFAVNAISAAHRGFLSRGGQTFFLGDGALNARPEQVVELYYSARLAPGLALTLDAQRIRNPGYNADRGPASFYAIRAHWEN